MKKLFLLFFALSFSASFAQTTYLQENFGYGSTASSDITVTAAGVWKRHSGSQGPTYLSTSLAYAGYQLSNVGGSLSFTNGSSGNNDGDANRLFTKDITTTSSIYVSFLLNLSSAKATADYFFHLAPIDIAATPAGTTFRGRIFAIASGAGYSLGLTKASSSNPTIGKTVLSFNTTYLVVLKYQFSTTATTDDLVTLYVLSSGIPSTEPSTAEVATLGNAETTADPLDIGALAVREGTNTPTGTIDGIYVASSWATIATGIEENISAIPTKYALNQNYPNPFNPSTVINYQLPEAGQVSLKVYDVLGNEVSTLVNEFKQAGVYNAKFSNSQLSSGIYFYKLQVGNFVSVKKMMLAK